MRDRDFLGRVKYLNLIFAVIGIVLILLGILVIDGLIFKAIFTFVGVILLILIDPSSREYEQTKVIETPFMHDPRYYYKERYKGFIPERFLDIPPGIIITFILGWIFIIIGCYGTSTYLDYQHDGSMFPIYDRVEPEYTISAIVASIGIIILGICHLLMFVKTKSIPSILAAIFLGISGILILLYIAEESISLQIDFSSLSTLIYLTITLGFGFAGYDYFTLRRRARILAFSGIGIMVFGFPLLLLILTGMPLHMCLILPLILFLITLYGFVRIHQNALKQNTGQLYNEFRRYP